jgi:hypothetical protein
MAFHTRAYLPERSGTSLALVMAAVSFSCLRVHGSHLLAGVIVGRSRVLLSFKPLYCLHARVYVPRARESDILSSHRGRAIDFGSKSAM